MKKWQDLIQTDVSSTETSTLLQVKNYSSLDSPTFKQHIMNDFIKPSYERDIAYNIDGRPYWRKISSVFEWTSYVLIAVSSIASFVAGTTENTTWSFASFISVTLVPLCLRLEKNAVSKFEECTKNVNQYEKALSMPEIPEEQISDVENK